VIQKHEATRLHYDFRLELGGTLKSWAVPKGPSLNPHDRHLAMMVEDHPLEYRNFEGVIPKGQYGGGTVMLWDEGTFHAWGETDPTLSQETLLKGLKDGHLTFILEGQKLQGEFALIKIKDAKEEGAWLLVKKGDEYASESDVTKEDKSVRTGRTMNQIATGELNLSAFPKAAMPKRVKPMLAQMADRAFDREGWLYEVKWDGYRAVAEIGKKSVRLYSRNFQPFNDKFAPVAEALKKFGHEAVLDGEVVVVDKNGKSDFQSLQHYLSGERGHLIYYVFDLLWLDGHDLTGQPLSRRKTILAELVEGLRPAFAKASAGRQSSGNEIIKLSEHIESTGEAFFKAAVKQGLEGIIAKDPTSHYLMGKRVPAWQKIKTHLRQEAVIGGYTDPKGSRKDLGALVLGVYEDDDLVYIGHTGGGFSDQLLKDIRAQLEPLKQAKCPFSEEPKTNAPVVWVKPTLVCEVKFQEWTAAGTMRQPIFLGLRLDKPAKEVVRETPATGSDHNSLSKAAAESKGSDDRQVKAGARTVKVSNWHKIYWPEEGITKGMLIEYYQEVAGIMLPYLKDRPQSLNRHPHGITGSSFYQKDINFDPPDYVQTKEIWSESNQKNINFLLCQNEATLIYLANLGCIEINPWFSRVQHLEKPDYLVLDLDPEDIDFGAVVKTAQAVRQVLEAAGLPGYPKTSGATGLHIYVPLAAKYDYDQAKQFAEIVARLVNDKLPDITSVLRSPAKRQQRVYVDFLQNRHGQTLAAPYSVRPKPGATVSTPLDWREVNSKLRPGQFTIKNTLRRLDKLGDIWTPVLDSGVDLLKAIKGLTP
jgi:bifunctional non-homologous end joining protein LigD